MKYCLTILLITILSCDTSVNQKQDMKQINYKAGIIDTNNISVAVFVHDNVEILDLAAPIEIFDRAGMNVFTVGASNGLVKSQGVLDVKPEFTIDNCPNADIVVFVGGNGAKAAKNTLVTKWIQKIAPETPQFFTVCTGAFFLAEAGLLKNKSVTTFHDSISMLKEFDSSINVISSTRFVDDGQIISTAGVSAGIDGALYLVEKLMGKERVEKVIKYMEYPYWDKSKGTIIE